MIRKSGFKTDLEASQAYDEAFIQHGCFELNFPTEPWHTQAKRPTAPAYTGVSYEPLRNSWRVSHTAGGRIVRLYGFATEEAAARKDDELLAGKKVKFPVDGDGGVGAMAKKSAPKRKSKQAAAPGEGAVAKKSAPKRKPTEDAVRSHGALQTPFASTPYIPLSHPSTLPPLQPPCLLNFASTPYIPRRRSQFTL